MLKLQYGDVFSPLPQVFHAKLQFWDQYLARKSRYDCNIFHYVQIFSTYNYTALYNKGKGI